LRGVNRRALARHTVAGILAVAGGLVFGGSAMVLSPADSGASLSDPEQGGISIIHRTPPREPASAYVTIIQRTTIGADAPSESRPFWHSESLADTPLPLRWSRTLETAVVFGPQLLMPHPVVSARNGGPSSFAHPPSSRDPVRSIRVANAVPSDPAVVGSIGSTMMAAPSRVRIASLSPANEPATSLDDAQLARTAVYDISARTVYMPNGDKLEAHSGLGSLMDNPRSMYVKMRGVTPPNVYRLRLRERLFHGVQAVRLLPAEEKAMFRRNGMLAHTYMLGPSGQSNGCVSFKEYPRFLKAVVRGDVERLIVVTNLDRAPRFDGSDTMVARAQTEDAARRLAYAGNDTPPRRDPDIGASFTAWMSNFVSAKPAASR
jgi:hypothetical protein